MVVDLLEVFFETLISVDRYAPLTFELIEHMIRRFDIMYRGTLFQERVQKFLVKKLEVIVCKHLKVMKAKKQRFIQVISSLAFENSK